MQKPFLFYSGNREYHPDLDLYLQYLKGEKIALEICISYYSCHPTDKSRPTVCSDGSIRWGKPQIDRNEDIIRQYRKRLEVITAQLEIINKARWD